MKRILVATIVILCAGRVYAQTKTCTATIGDLTKAEDHIDVAATTVLSGCTIAQGAWQQIVVKFGSDQAGKICDPASETPPGFGTDTCTANVSFPTRCLADGTYTVYAVPACSGGSADCLSATVINDSRTFSLQRIVTLGVVAGQENPAGSGHYDLGATYNISNAYATERHIAAYDAKTGALLGGCSATGLDQPSGTCIINGVTAGCLGLEVRVVATACGTSATAEAKGTLPPDPAACTNQAFRGCANCQTNQSGAADHCPNCKGKSVGSPINVGGGDVAFSVPLFSISEPTEPVSFELYYDSARPVFVSVSGEMGFGWSHSFSQSLRAISGNANYLYHVQPTGKERIFLRSGTTWTAMRPSNSPDVITQVGSEYRLLQPDGKTVAFDVTSGRWISTTDRWGNATTATYDGGGNLAGVTDPLGRAITIVTTGTALQQMTLPGGATWTFGYTNGNLTSIHDPLHAYPGPAWRTFEYANDGYGEPRLLTSMKDDAGVILESHTYDTQDRGISSASANGRDQVTIQYDYPAAGKRRITHQTDGTTTQLTDFTVAISDNEWVTTAMTGACATCGTSSGDTRTYDTSGRVTRSTNALGVATSYTYDAAGNVVSMTEAEGTALARTTTYEYAMPNWAALRTKETVPGPYGTRVTTHAFSADERTLTDTTTGRTTSGGSSVTYTTTTTFDGRHRLLSIDGPRADVTDTETRTYYGDTDADVNRRGRLQSVTTAIGLTTSYDAYDIYGTPRRITDPNGVVSTIETDARGRATAAVSQPVNGDSGETTEYRSITSFDSRDRASQTISPRAIKTAYVYDDGTNRLTGTIRYELTGNQIERLHLTFNLVGWKTQEEAQSCTTPAVVCTTWSSKRSESFTYDGQGHLKDIVHPDGTTQSFTYDSLGRVSTVKDENHTTANTTYAYDVLDRLQSVTQTLAGASGGTVTTSYTYNVQDQVASVTDPNGNVMTYENDDFGRLQRQSSPVTGSTTYTYDAAGNVISTTDANGSTTTRQYDASNRITTATSSRTGAATQTTSWSYDSTVGGTYGRGRLATMTDPTGTTTYTYDRRGLLKRETKTIESNTYTTSYGYDAAGNRTSITYPSGMVVTYDFDFADRPNTASMGAASLVTTASYLPFGPLSQIVFGNGTTQTLAYDNRYQMASNRLSGGGTLAEYTYTHDGFGNVTGITDTIAAPYNRTFAYDDLNRLTSASSGTSLWGPGSYTYDRMGNMLTTGLGSARSRSFTYAGLTPMLQSVNEDGATRSVVYDAAGNETSVGTEQYTYDARNSRATSPGMSYEHDGRGVRTITRVMTDVTITSFNVSPTAVGGGTNATATVTISAAAPAGGVTVTLTSDNAAIARVGQSVVIAAGATSGTAIVTTSATQTDASVILRSWLGTSTATTTLTVQNSSIQLASVTVAPNYVVGGRQNSTGTVTLTQPEPPGGATVVLTSSDTTAATVPVSVTVNSGATTATLTITTQTVGAPVNVTISGSYGSTQTTSLTVTSCAAFNPPPPAFGTETVWFDDALPAGASGNGGWDTTQKASGTQSLRSDDNLWPSFSNANPRLHFDKACDALIMYVLLDPCAPPQEIMLQIQTFGNGYRWAFWGANIRNVSSGTLGVSRFYVGPLPPVGQWVRLSMPMSAIGLTSEDIYGITFEAVGTGGRTWFDRVGKETGSTGIATPPASFLSGDTVWFEDSPPANATLGGTWLWDATQKASGTSSHHDPAATGLHGHDYTTPTPLVMGPNDRLFVYALLDPCNPPRQVLLQWFDGSTWDHKVYWGPNLIGGTVGTPTTVARGDLPPLGQWVRLEVAASAANVTNVYGMLFRAYDGNIWFDRAGNITCPVSASPPSTLPSTEVVWIEDAPPPGATLTGTWNWDTTQKASGTQSHTDPSKYGLHYHYLQNATSGLPIGVGDKLITYVLLHPCDTPDEVLLEWYAAGGWEHRAYWGLDRILAGVDGTNSRRSMGDLPASGQWVRLEIPAAQVGLEGLTITGMAFNLHNGQAWFDRSGKSPAGSGALMLPSSTMIPSAAAATPSMKTRFAAWLRRVGAKLRGSTPPVGLAVAMQLTAETNAIGDTRRYSFYSPELNLLSETSLTSAATPSIAYEYVWFGGEPLAQVETASGTLHYYFNDHLGTPLLTTNSTGAIDWRVEREPYGSLFAVRAGGDRHQPLGFPGQEYDEQNPQQAYNIFRWYRAGWGRYTEPDPAWDGIDVRELNHYLYVAGNPTIWTDPLGLKIEVCCRPLAGAFGALLTSIFGPTHCFMRVTEPPLPVAGGQPAGTLSISALPLKPYGQRKAVKRFHYPDDQNYSGSDCQSSPDTCERRRCLQEAFKNFPSGLTYANTGINSNTFTRSIVAKCGLAAPPELFHNAPGIPTVPIN